MNAFAYSASIPDEHNALLDVTDNLRQLVLNLLGYGVFADNIRIVSWFKDGNVFCVPEEFTRDRDRTTGDITWKAIEAIPEHYPPPEFEDDSDAGNDDEWMHKLNDLGAFDDGGDS